MAAYTNIDEYIKEFRLPEFGTYLKDDLSDIISVINKKLVPKYKSVVTKLTDHMYEDICPLVRYFGIGEVTFMECGEVFLNVNADNSGNSKFCIHLGKDDTGLPFPFGAVRTAVKYLRCHEKVTFHIGRGEEVLEL